MATEITKISSNKGGECVIVNGYKFCKGYLKENNSKIVWRCSIRNCPAVLVTNMDTTTVVSTSGSHSHPPLTGLAETQTARVSCKRKAMDDFGCRPAQVTSACLAQVAADNMTRSDVKKLTRSVQDVRRKKYPKAPRDFIELHIEVDALDSVTTRNEKFVLLNDIPSHTVIFTCDSVA